MQKLTGYIPIVALAGILALPGGLQAAEPDAHDTDSTITVHGSAGEELTVTIADGAITVVSKEDGDTSTAIVDLDAVGLLAADAMEEALAGMEDVFAELEDLQLDVSLGQDNRLNVSCDDSEFELDLDQVMAQVASAVQVGLQEFDTDDWSRQKHRHRNHGVDEATRSEEELRDELSALKAEMKALRAEMKSLRADDSN